MSPFRTFAPILALALIVRLGAAFWWQNRLPDDQPFAMPDSESYWTLAQAVAEGEPYQYGGIDGQVFRAPGLPLWLAPQIYLLGPGQLAVTAARISGALLGTLTVALIMLWARQLWGPSATLPAGLLGGLYPGAIVMSVLILSEMLFCPLMVAHLYLWYRAVHSERPATSRYQALASGVLAGLATLTRPSWLLFVPGAAAIGWIAFPPRSRQLLVAGLIVVGLSLTMLPWWIRNYRVTGHFIPTTLQVGASLYDGWSPEATGASDMTFTQRFYDQLKEEQRTGQLPADANFEYELDQRLRQEAKSWARENPLRALALMGIKFQRMWNIWPNDPEYRGAALRWITLVGYVPTLLLALWGAYRCPRANWSLALALLPACYFTALHLVFVSSMRYREPAMLALIVLAAGPAALVARAMLFRLFRPNPAAS